jgi:hypothetical protein
MLTVLFSPELIILGGGGLAEVRPVRQARPRQGPVRNRRGAGDAAEPGRHRRCGHDHSKEVRGGIDPPPRSFHRVVPPLTNTPLVRARPGRRPRRRHRARGPRGQRGHGAVRRSTAATRRVWYAEHHNMASIASSATSVLIAHVAANTTNDPPGLGRHHVAQPLPPHHRRAVRHAGHTPSRPNRPWPGSGAGNRPGDDARPPARPHVRRVVPGRRARAAGLPRLGKPHSRRPGHTRAPAPTSRCTSWGPPRSAPSWPHSSAFPTPSPRTSPPRRSPRRSRSTGRGSAHPSRPTPRGRSPRST